MSTGSRRYARLQLSRKGSPSNNPTIHTSSSEDYGDTAEHRVVRTCSRLSGLLELPPLPPLPDRQRAGVHTGLATRFSIHGGVYVELPMREQASRAMESCEHGQFQKAAAPNPNDWFPSLLAKMMPYTISVIDHSCRPFRRLKLS